MTRPPEIRESTGDDLRDIELLYPLAFPDEDLLPVVRDLLRDPGIALSLVATIDSDVVGHVAFTRCGLSGSNEKAAMLAPLAVSPAHQKQGLGNKLVRAGLRQMEHEDVDRVFVLGDPGYYGRFGFQPGSVVLPPYPLPAEWQHAWQSLSLAGTDLSRPGKLELPELWLQPSLWLPPAD